MQTGAGLANCPAVRTAFRVVQISRHSHPLACMLSPVTGRRTKPRSYPALSVFVARPHLARDEEFPNYQAARASSYRALDCGRGRQSIG